RRFLERSVAAGMAGFGAVGSVAASSEQGARKSLGIGVIGVRRRGLELAKAFASASSAEVVALCDIDPQMRQTALRGLAPVQSRVPKLMEDYRRLLDDPAIDAVVVATPDHWHAPMALAALEAGKDLYLEAPVTHTLEEATKLQAAAKESGRVIQCGLQQRSGEHFLSAMKLLHEGGIGRIGFARAWAVHRRGEPRLMTPAMGEVDYSNWLGPAPSITFDPLRFHHHWRWFWDYGS